MAEPDLEKVLAQARAWNLEHDLTGILLYSDGVIMQVLEGAEAEVRAIFARIARDSRHVNVLKLADGPIGQRQFVGWSMGFKAVDSNDFAHLQGYIDPNQLANHPSPDPSLHAMLATFMAEDVVRF